MIKWFVATIIVLLGVIAVLGWRLNMVTSVSTERPSSPAAQFISDQTFSEARVKDLFHMRGCVNCHDSRNTLLGPSFLDIAERYHQDASARDTLITSLRQGSQGKWGTVHSMPIHTKASLSDAEAKVMIDWMLEPENNQ